VENPETDYAIAPDGVYLAYQTLGTGEPALVWQTDWPGNIDFEWEDKLVGTFLREVASFTRVITHDQRGIGLSSRNVAPADLETRAADLRVVLETTGVDRVVLCGIYNSGGVNALLAATDPERVHSIVWIEPSARTVAIPDYPWGATPEYREAEAATLEVWGTSRYGPAHVEHENAFGNAVPTEYGDLVSRQSRNACTPDVAKQMSENWYQIDVRAVLPAVKSPTLLLTRGGPDDPEANYLASLMPNAEIRPIPPGTWSADNMKVLARELRHFMGVEPPPPTLDSVLAAVLFTDIVGSTAKQATLGDAGWKALLEQHHAAVRNEIERWHGIEVDTAGDSGSRSGPASTSASAP
jgi:pimeloyl-ACP methyl ester carboxylesterase